MRSIFISLLLAIVTFAVEPIKVLEMEETETRKFVSVEWAGVGDYSPYVAYQTGDSSDALIKIEIYHLDKGVVGTYNIPPSYKNEYLNDIYLGYTNGDEVPAFLYGRNFWGAIGSISDGSPTPPNSSYLLDEKLNVILTETGVHAGISLFRVENSTYAVTGTNATPEKRTYYRLRDDLSSAIYHPQKEFSRANPAIYFSSNGEIAHFSNLKKQSDFEVFTMQGRRIYKTNIAPNSVSQPLPPMAAGTYIGRIKAKGSETAVTPFVKN